MMVLRYYANAPATTLESSCSAVATSIIVVSTAGLPISYPYTLILDRGTATEEAVSVTAAGGTTLTVTRGIDDTTAFAHGIGGTVEHGITAQDIREPNTHINSDNGVHGVTGDVVGTSDVQHLTNKTTDTPATSDDTESLATTEFVKAVLLAANPVGSIAFNVTGDNPSTYIGGTWTAWGSGRVPVGVDAGQSEFNTVEETGGAKTHTLTTSEMPSHSHGGATGGQSQSHVHQQTYNSSAIAPSGGSAIGGMASSGSGGPTASEQYTNGANQDHVHGISAEGGGAAHNNLQPYITCYMFKRTA